MLEQRFFDRDTIVVARELLGKVIRHKVDNCWLSAKIIETEAYYMAELGSHSSLGRTPSREAMFRDAGTIYMYYSRGRDSLNISCQGAGNGVLIKSGYPWVDEISSERSIKTMQKLNPKGGSARSMEKLCSGQTLLCAALGLKVRDWNMKNFNLEKFYIDDIGDKPSHIITATRLGIPKGRDEHLPYRFIHGDYNRYCTKPQRK